MFTSSGAPLSGHEDLFSDSKATSSGPVSGALSVSKQEKKKTFTKPIDVETALKYMKEHGCSWVDYYKYTAALVDKTVLVGFCALRSYEERKRYLTELWEKGMVSAPALVKAPALGNAPPGLQ